MQDLNAVFEKLDRDGKVSVTGTRIGPDGNVWPTFMITTLGHDFSGGWGIEELVREGILQSDSPELKADILEAQAQHDEWLRANPF